MYDDRNVKVCMMFAMCVKNVCIMGACGRFAKGSSSMKMYKMVRIVDSQWASLYKCVYDEGVGVIHDWIKNVAERHQCEQAI
jgi:hypothetical protein